MCLLLQDLVQSCFRGEGGILVVCPSRTSERGGEGDCVKEGGGGEGKCERERALERLREIHKFFTQPATDPCTNKENGGRSRPVGSRVCGL